MRIYVEEALSINIIFFITRSNKTCGYFVATEAYDYRCYESVTSRFNKEIAEKVSDILVNMLNKIKGE